MHKNSLEAYCAIEAELPDKSKKVFAVVVNHCPITRQDIAARLSVPINQVTGRVKELLDSGVIEEKGKIKTDTGRSRSLLVVTARETQLEMDL